jgi:hypothetical protein
MKIDTYRPWGSIDWLSSKAPGISWDIIGCISFEQRCTGLQSNTHLPTTGNNLYFEILPTKTDQSNDHKRQLDENKKTLLNLGVTPSQIHPVNLLERVSTFIEQVINFARNSNGNIALDISCFPKRFFFPILKILVGNDSIKNLWVVYTKPTSYTKEELSGNPSEWSHIPTFLAEGFPEKDVDVAIVGVGFMPLGLPQLLTGSYQDAKVKLLFPYPPGPPNYQRNWEFVRRIEDQYPGLDLNGMYYIHALNMSDAFDHLHSITDGGQIGSILAPYGPKPISAAMSLFATKYGVPVYYTQPNYYSPFYSSGVGEVTAYWIIHNYINLY